MNRIRYKITAYLGIILMLVPALSSGCSMSGNGSDESLSGGWVRIYQPGDDGIIIDDEPYQLKKPDSVSAVAEEVLPLINAPEGLSFSGYTVDEDGVLHIDITDFGSDNKDILLYKAAVVRTLSQSENIKTIELAISLETGQETDLATYTDASFYYFD